MKLADLGEGAPVVPWAAGGKIPWHEPAFSERMLREHLSQEHDRASRRFETISTHVEWLHDHVLGRVASRVLDLGCGPGFYTSRLARLDHACVGVDFSPASISHARSEAEKAALPCHYHLEDLVTADLGEGFDLALLIFGELNTFPPAEAKTILANIRSAVGPSGALVMEVASEKHVRSLAAQAPTWFGARQSVFSDEPHLCLKECAWHDESRTAIERYVVVTLQSSEVAHYTRARPRRIPTTSTASCCATQGSGGSSVTPPSRGDRPTTTRVCSCWSLVTRTQPELNHDRPVASQGTAIEGGRSWT